MKKKNEIFEKIQTKILELMETEGSDWTKSWIGKGAPINHVTKKAYRGMNYFWLSCQDYNSNEWGTFKQWSEKDYKIKKGSKATQVVFASVKPKKESWLTDGELANYRSTGQLPTYFMWRTYYVFNAEQIEDFVTEKVDHKHETELSSEQLKLIESYISNTKAIIDDSRDSAFYSPIQDTIGMPKKENFITDVTYYSTLLHELTHWTGHKSRCERELTGMHNKEEYAKEELVAEIGSAFMCQILNVEKTVRKDHAQYLNSWIKAIKDDSKAMITAFSQAQKAVDYLENLQLNLKKEVA